MKNKKILLSGVKPTGKPHIGNYFGAMKQFVDLQEEYDGLFMIVDYHALNFIQNAEEMRRLTHGLALDYLGIGLKPESVTIFKQSSVPEHTELCWIFDTITTMPYLMRAHAFKDAEAKNKEISAGAFNYPMLMAADILLYDSNVVPVGQDQKQHVEYARDTALKFNRIFGEVFILPEPLIMKEVAIVPGTDGRKMSKSYGNVIPLFAEDKEIEKSVMSIVTDSKGVDEKKDPETCNVFAIHKLITPPEELNALRKKYEEGGIGYGESKQILLKNLLAYFGEMRERRKFYEERPELVEKILREGGEKARARASAKMAIIREKVGLL